MAKICILLPTHWDAMKGGAEYQADCFAKYLKDSTDHEVVYLARYVADDNSSNGYEICKIPTLIRDERFGLFWDAITLYKKLCSINPDVILQHVGCAYTGIATFFCKRRNKSIIWLLASDDDVKQKKLSFAPKRWPANIDDLLLKYGIRNSTSIVAQTKNQADKLQVNYKRSVIEIIPNFHPLPKRLEREKRQNESDHLNVYWIANIKKLKQPEIFIKLANDCEEYKNIKFKIIGRREKSEWCDEIFNKIHESRNLEYIGELDIEDVNKQLESAHVLVNTSLYEGFPNTFIQAWMREVPTLSLNVDPDGIINNNKIGLYAETYENLKKYIIYINKNIKELEDAGKRAEKFSIKNYSMKNADRLIKVIDENLKAMKCISSDLI